MPVIRPLWRFAEAYLPEPGKRRIAFAMLGYLLFLFAPLLGRWFAFAPLQVPFHLGATLLSLLLFLPLYFRLWRHATRGIPWALAVLAVALLPWNGYAHTYLIYAVCCLGGLPGRLGTKLGQALLMVLAYGLVFYRFWPHPAVWLLMLMSSLIAFAGLYQAHSERERERHQAALKLSQDEVRSLAAFAERERIGRDLHDLLGHTLSMVALKAELAARLAGQDGRAAGQEMRDVAAIAREALKEVRSTVSGIRSTVLAAELASAKLLLEMQNIHMTRDIAPIPLPAAQETALALCLREAATNVQRHAAASRLHVRLWQEGGRIHLHLHDDGRGGAHESGTGLAGMRERIERLGGQVVLESPPGQGTRLHLSLPLVGVP